MRFSAATLLAFAASVLAQKAATDGFDPISKPAENENVPAGKAFEIVWEVAPQYKDLKVDIELLGGKDPNTLVSLGKIATGIDNAAGKYSWDVDSKLGKDAKYGLTISNAANPDIFQWSHPFNIKAAEGGDTTTTLTKDQGVKTVTLSSSTPTSTSVSSSSIAHNTTTARNTTTSAHKPTSTSVLLTTTQPAVTTTDSTPTPSPSSAAGQVGAGVMAALGGVALALFAL